MKKTYPASKKASSPWGWWKHLRWYGKRTANKSTRRIYKQEAEQSRREES